jgi:FkbM family methyltransferase
LSHKARSFSTLPDPNRAAALLSEIASAPCPFAAVPADVPLALYGAGNLGKLARDFLHSVGHDIALAVDRNAEALADDPDWAGVRLFHPDEVPDLAKPNVRVAVSVVNAPYVPLEAALHERGFPDVVPFYDLAESFRHLHPLSNGWFAPPFTHIDFDDTVRVLAHWDDDISRAHHLQFLAWRRLREEWSFEPAPAPAGERFFIPEVASVLHGKECFLDAGAHHGSVAQAFIRHTQGEFRQIIAVEPDPSNRAILQNTLRSGAPDDARIAICDFALAEEEHLAPFHDGLGYVSQLSNTGRLQVMTRRLDALMLSPSFVKLHLEGGEHAALLGGCETLLRSRPIVAATVYHNADGIWKTARWLIDTLQDYRFLFRAHSWCGTGAVVYAIPHERLAA